MKHKQLLYRYLLLCVGLVIMAFGVAFSIQAELGTSPISSLPYVLSLLTPLSVGTATIAMHVTLILLQILLLRSRFQLVQLMQFPVALLFGYLTDFALWVIGNLHAESYLGSWILCLFGIVLVGIGVSFEVNAGVVTLAGEGMVLAVCQTFHFPFPKTKIGFDCTLVGISVILGLVFLGHLAGVREGTVAAAVCVGLVSKQMGKWIVGRVTARYFT